MIKVAIIDDHHMVVEGLERVLQTLANITVTATYNKAQDLLQGLKQSVPDVLLLDVQLPDLPGEELAKMLAKKYPEIRILVLSGVESNYYIQEMIQNGCYGYVFKSTTDRELLRLAIETVYKEEVFLDPSIRNDFLHNVLLAKRKKNILKPKLTGREKEVLELIVKEYNNYEIAQKLSLSLRTIENHRYHLFQKLDVKTSVSLMKAALQMGLCD